MSARKLRLILSPEARQDLRDILLYTERRWDKQRRVAYKTTLDQAIQGLVGFPNRGRVRDDVSPGLRGLPIEAHVVYYRVDERTVTVVRILHGAMDAADNLEM